MLDLDHPKSAHVFAASRQIDLILDYAKRISFDDEHGRQFMTCIVAPCFAALHWLNENHFENDRDIRERITELQSALDRLATCQTASRDSRLERKNCPVCTQKLTAPNQYDPIPYCPDCLDIVLPALIRLQSCDGGFGTEAI